MRRTMFLSYNFFLLEETCILCAISTPPSPWIALLLLHLHCGSFFSLHVFYKIIQFKEPVNETHACARVGSAAHVTRWPDEEKYPQIRVNFFSWLTRSTIYLSLYQLCIYRYEILITIFYCIKNLVSYVDLMCVVLEDGVWHRSIFARWIYLVWKDAQLTMWYEFVICM